MLKEKCIELGISLSKLGKMSNISKSYLSRIDNEEFTNLTIQIIIKLSKGLEMSEIELYSYYSKIEHSKMD